MVRPRTGRRETRTYFEQIPVEVVKGTLGVPGKVVGTGPPRLLKKAVAVVRRGVKR